MPPADSVRKQILDDLKDALEVTAGDDYNYTPDRVEIIDPPALKLLMDQAQRDIPMLYLVSGDTSSEEHATTGGYQRDRFEVYVFGSHVYDVPTQDEFAKIDDGQEQKWQMREKMIRDAKRAVQVDINRGGVAQNTNITNVRPIYDIKEIPERAMFEMRLEVIYTYQKATP